MTKEETIIAYVSEVLKARYGQVLVKIHDGRIVRIEKTVAIEPKSTTDA